jgi:oxygen-independent coproporphyrinogen-3 oxidase
MFNVTSLPPLSLYVHIPWCIRKCPYCDFNSHELRGDLPQDAYVDALLRDLEQDLPRTSDRPVQSLFLGGGTPSLFAPAAIARFLSGVRDRIDLADDCEITLEANPGTVDARHFAGYRAAGVNRLSIGIQSFSDEKLKTLGRIHNRGEAIRAATAVRQSGFDNFNLDLMFGLPHQSVEQAAMDVRTAIELEPSHLSVYQLTLEPNTLFHAHPPPLPADETIWAMQETIQTLLARAGYRQYEVSAYARPGRECRHNLNYWEFGDYLGIGAGAHAKLTGTDGIERLIKRRQPAAYVDTAGTKINVVSERRLTKSDTAFEFMLNALRLTPGFAPGLFSEHTGLPLAAVRSTLDAARRKGLLAVDDMKIQPTELGRRFLNDLIAMFLPVEPAA